MIMLFLQLELEEAEPSTESEEFREQHEEVIHINSLILYSQTCI